MMKKDTSIYLIQFLMVFFVSSMYFCSDNNDDSMLPTPTPTHEPRCITFSRAYGTALNDEFPHSVIQTEDDGYAAFGSTYNYETGIGYDAYFIRVDAKGEQLWSKTYEYVDNSHDFGYRIKLLPDEGYLLLMSTCKQDSENGSERMGQNRKQNCRT